MTPESASPPAPTEADLKAMRLKALMALFATLPSPSVAEIVESRAKLSH